MHRRADILVFDRYLNGEMDATERQVFEERLMHSSTLKKSFEAYQDFSAQLAEGAEYAVIRDELSEIHAGLYSKKKPLILKPKFIAALGIAATITLLIILNPFGSFFTGSGDQSAYEPLAHNDVYYATEEMAEETETDDAMYMDSTVEQGAQLLDSMEHISRAPHGTAFLISNQGYFLTAKHLVESKTTTTLQHKELDLTFETDVVYIDSLLDFAILKCSDQLAEVLDPVPYNFVNTAPELAEEVFTLGYPKKDIVYTQGVVSSETGYESDTIYFEVSLPSNAGDSGAPLFNASGKLVGIITAKHAEKQAVTYILKHDYILDRMENLGDSLHIDWSKNSTKRYSSTSKMIRAYRPYIFEVH